MLETLPAVNVYIRYKENDIEIKEIKTKFTIINWSLSLISRVIVETTLPVLRSRCSCINLFNPSLFIQLLTLRPSELKF